MKKLATFLVSATWLVVLLVPWQGTVSGLKLPAGYITSEHKHSADDSEVSTGDRLQQGGGSLSLNDPDRAPAGHRVTTERRQIGDNPESLIWTWGNFRKDVPLSIGVTFTEPALDDMFTAEADGVFPRLLSHLTAPHLEAGRVYDLPFPEKVRRTTPFNHLGWFANAQGHSPPGVFDLAHVDVHFFIITVEQRQALSGQLTDPRLLDLPPEGFLPADFFLPTFPGTDIPATNDAEQGLHWVDSQAPELRGALFRQIFIFGSYDGKVNFWEPMITKQFFEDMRTFLTDLQSTERTIALTFAIKQPTKFLKTSYYPTHYTISYNADAGEFTVSLDKFAWRKGVRD